MIKPFSICSIYAHSKSDVVTLFVYLVNLMKIPNL